jgi:hypothetical protein
MNGLGAQGQYPLGGGPTQSIVAWGWFTPLSDPVRTRPASHRGAHQTLAFHPNPVVPFGWFEGLAEPVRVKPGLRPELQQFFAADTDVIPVSRTFWFQPLSEPVRIKPGLKASLQQFLAAPSRLIPTPATSGVLDALETKDTFLAGAMLWNRATDAEIGVINTTPQPAEIAVYPAAPTVGQVFARISVRIEP